MRRRARTDANQAEIVRQLREIPGVTVTILAQMGDGIPDLCVGYGKRTFLFEVKRPGCKLTLDEQHWHDAWRGHAAIVTCIEDCLREMGMT